MEISTGALLAGRYVPVAAASVLLYNHLLTIDDEFTSIWENKKSSDTMNVSSKLVFFLNRYGIEIMINYVVFVHSEILTPLANRF
ncbi:hypothetical protein BDQ17DRAFT_1351482 [Cyathus striatus]|nr:hypothetical protein BDQ17DRAFT_1379941 [Cyathus striatus]KAF9007131.1 hypothetical protein BDQ17DRAFT_1351482 [Cyathus striatus]